MDPYYLTHKAVEVGYQPEMILAGRRINDNMGYFIAENTVKELVKRGVNLLKSKIAIIGFTFKNDCPDLRNTKVFSVYEKLKTYGCNIVVSDHWADEEEVFSTFNFHLTSLKDIKNQDAVIMAVDHSEYKNLNLDDFKFMLKENGVFIDVKSVFKKGFFKKTKIKHWKL